MKLDGVLVAGLDGVLGASIQKAAGFRRYTVWLLARMELDWTAGGWSPEQSRINRSVSIGRQLPTGNQGAQPSLTEKSWRQSCPVNVYLDTSTVKGRKTPAWRFDESRRAHFIP